MSAVTRLLPTEEAEDLVELTREICARELAPEVDESERQGLFPERAFRVVGDAGLLGLPFPEDLGGGGQPYEVYLQVIEELAATWMTVAAGASIHVLSCLPVLSFGTSEQQEQLLPEMIDGRHLGAFCLSEAEAGSDIASMRTRAQREGPAGEPGGGDYVIRGQKMWTSHAGHATHYTTFARTGEQGPKGISCLIARGDAEGFSFAEPERKMGLHGDLVRQVTYDGVRVPADRLIGGEGAGMSIALAALDSGRLGIAASATGLAQAALAYAAAYAGERRQFGRPVADNQGLAFDIADMAAAVGSARATYLHAARLKDAGKPFTREAAIAKLTATDAAMRVTTAAIQVLGGAGYVEDHPVERWFREAKITQIFEGTNQIQRLVISRHVLADIGAGSR